MSQFIQSFKWLCLFGLLAWASAAEADAEADNNHDHHHHQNTTNSTIEVNEKQGGGQIFFLTYNQTCEDAGRPPCNPSSNLECSYTSIPRRCLCAPGFTYVRDTETCWPIARADDLCHHDVQCHYGRWGNMSRCDKRNMTCNCYDYPSGKREVILVDGVCYLNKTIGALCDNDDECDKPIRGEAYCKPGDYTGGGGYRNYTGSCQCQETHMWYFPSKKCLKKSTDINDQCQVGEQCREGVLGQHSWCNIATGQCNCKPKDIADNTTTAVYYKTLNRCFLRKEYNDTCEDSDECKASLGPDVLCGNPSDADGDKICYCPKRTGCRSGGFSTVLGASSPLTMGVCVTAAVIGMSISMGGLGGGMQMTGT